MSNWKFVCKFKDIKSGEMLALSINDKNILIIKDKKNKIYAISNLCSHGDVPLSEGQLNDNLIECWGHGGTFDIRTGNAESLPVVDDIPVFATKVEKSNIYVDIKNILNKDNL